MVPTSSETSGHQNACERNPKVDRMTAPGTSMSTPYCEWRNSHCQCCSQATESFGQKRTLWSLSWVVRNSLTSKPSKAAWKNEKFMRTRTTSDD